MFKGTLEECNARLSHKNVFTDEWNVAVRPIPKWEYVEGGPTHELWANTYNAPPVIMLPALDPLMALPQWINWFRNSIGKKPALKPFAVESGESNMALTTDSETWGTVQQAVHKYRSCTKTRSPTGGIGFVLTPEDAFICVDFDTKKLAPDDPWRKWIADFIHHWGSHCHISPSGDGYHLVGYIRDRSILKGFPGSFPLCPFIDVLWHTCYFTVTDKLFLDSPLAELDGAVQQLFATFTVDAATAVATTFDDVKTIKSDMTLQELHAKILASKQGEKYTALMSANPEYLAEHFPSRKRGDSHDRFKGDHDNHSRHGAWTSLCGVIHSHCKDLDLIADCMVNSRMIMDGKWGKPIRSNQTAADFVAKNLPAMRAKIIEKIIKPIARRSQRDSANASTAGAMVTGGAGLAMAADGAIHAVTVARVMLTTATPMIVFTLPDGAERWAHIRHIYNADGTPRDFRADNPNNRFKLQESLTGKPVQISAHSPALVDIKI